jgi:dihydroorotase
MKLPLAQTLATVTEKPARIMGVPGGSVAVGEAADLCLFDPQAMVRITAEGLRSQGMNTPFIGYELPGKVRYTLVSGLVVYEG